MSGKKNGGIKSTTLFGFFYLLLMTGLSFSGLYPAAVLAQEVSHGLIAPGAADSNFPVKQIFVLNDYFMGARREALSYEAAKAAKVDYYPEAPGFFLKGTPVQATSTSYCYDVPQAAYLSWQTNSDDFFTKLAKLILIDRIFKDANNGILEGNGSLGDVFILDQIFK